MGAELQQDLEDSHPGLLLSEGLEFQSQPQPYDFCACRHWAKVEPSCYSQQDGEHPT